MVLRLRWFIQVVASIQFQIDVPFLRDEHGDRANTVTVLVTHGRKSNGLCALVVPQKGVGGGFAVKHCVRDTKKFGRHDKIMIRTDGGPAIRDCMKRVSELRPVETALDTPLVGSKSHGRAERAVQTPTGG